MAQNNTVNPGQNPLFLGVTRDYKMPNAPDLYAMAQQRAFASQQYAQASAQNQQVLLQQSKQRVSMQTYINNIQNQKNQENSILQLRQAQGYSSGSLVYQQNVANQQSANALGYTQNNYYQQQNQLSQLSNQFAQQKDAIQDAFVKQVTQEEYEKQQYANQLNAQAASKKWNIAGWITSAASILVSFIPVIGPALAVGIDVGFGLTETIAGATVNKDNLGDWRTGASVTSGAINIGLGAIGALPLGKMINSFRGVGKTAADAASNSAKMVREGLEQSIDSLGTKLDDIAKNSANIYKPSVGVDTNFIKNFKGEVSASALVGDKVWGAISPQAADSLMGETGFLKQAYKNASADSSAMNKLRDVMSAEVGAGRISEHDADMFIGFFEQSKNLTKAGRKELLNTMADNVGGIWKDLALQVDTVIFKNGNNLAKQMGRSVNDALDEALGTLEQTASRSKSIRLANEANAKALAKIDEKAAKFGINGREALTAENLNRLVSKGELELSEATSLLKSQTKYAEELQLAIKNFKETPYKDFFNSQLNDLMKGAEYTNLDRAAFGSEYTQRIQDYINKTLKSASKDGNLNAELINKLRDEVVSGDLMRQFKNGTGVFSEMSAGSLANTLKEREAFRGLDEIAKNSVINAKTIDEAGQTAAQATEMITKQRGMFKGKFSSIADWLEHVVKGNNLGDIMKFDEAGKITWMSPEFKNSLSKSKEFTATYNAYKQKYAQRLFENNGALTKRQYNEFLKNSPELKTLQNYIKGQAAIYKQTGIIYDATAQSAKLVLKKSMPKALFGYGSGITPQMMKTFSTDFGAWNVYKMIAKQALGKAIGKGVVKTIKTSVENGMRNKAADNQYLKNNVDRYNQIFMQLGLTPIEL